MHRYDIRSHPACLNATTSMAIHVSVLEVSDMSQPCTMERTGCSAARDLSYSYGEASSECHKPSDPYEQKHGRRNRLEVFVIVGDHGTIAGPGNQCTVYAVDK
jgi:hypothetical protein